MISDPDVSDTVTTIFKVSPSSLYFQFDTKTGTLTFDLTKNLKVETYKVYIILKDSNIISPGKSTY